jgi:hypothetical protein
VPRWPTCKFGIENYNVIRPTLELMIKDALLIRFREVRDGLPTSLESWNENLRCTPRRLP